MKAKSEQRAGSTHQGQKIGYVLRRSGETIVYAGKVALLAVVGLSLFIVGSLIRAFGYLVRLGSIGPYWFEFAFAGGVIYATSQGITALASTVGASLPLLWTGIFIGTVALGAVTVGDYLAGGGLLLFPTAKIIPEQVRTSDLLGWSDDSSSTEENGEEMEYEERRGAGYNDDWDPSVDVDAGGSKIGSRDKSSTTSDESDTDMTSTEYLREPPSTNFDDVGGMEELKSELRSRVIEPLENPEKYERYGLSVENGLLLYGPPGTGKTYISKALAGELGINYIQVKGSDIIERWIGAGTENVAQLFEEAREHQPCLVFVDEIDALTPNRSGQGQHQDQMNTVNQFLEEVSEINEQDHDIVIIGATNRADQIDDAMLRSGRLSEKIEVPPPDATSRIAILDNHLDAPVAGETIQSNQIADASEGLTAADMQRVADEAAWEAMEREGKVTHEDLIGAIQDIKAQEGSY
ncbi:ATP-binding protein [Halorhabdus salina]|uniref:ATP-binding protein n=1 Tax=Halorhabdus salina TaxID=2750670 RepID=UPI001C68295F|nr:AAA family ATPase [Halorhabdus salina]